MLKRVTRLILFIAALGFCSLSYATAQVQITSFTYAGQDTTNIAAEVCGQVTGSSASSTMVRITVDPDNKHPGIYNTFAGADGLFCVEVQTYTGEATASLPAAGPAFHAATSKALRSAR
jgi:hypothetical protein